ncbi:MAG: SpoIIE family protein phosphatase [Acidobacteriota bacterium]
MAATPDIPLTLRLQRGTGKAVPDQVAEQVRGWVREGRIESLQSLPALRSLARGAGAHPSLVARGLERLEREGWIESHESGYRVPAALPLVDGRESLDSQIASAREAQRRLLPEALVSDELSIVAYGEPLHEVSGDFYDWFSDANGRRWSVTVGDVSGKGLAAGLVMASVQTALRMSAGHADPGRVMTDLNVEVGERTRDRDFVALSLLEIDLDERVVNACSAGAPDVLHFGAEGLRSVQLAGPRLPLGLRPAVTYETGRLELTPGDQLLIVSDGLPETPTGDGELLGYARFEERVTSLLSGDEFGEETLHRFVEQLDLELGGQPSDDRTAVWVRFGSSTGGAIR